MLQRCKRRWFSIAKSASYKKRLELTITSLNDAGDGVGRDATSGLEIVVPFALPGSVINAEVWDRDLIHKSYGREKRIIGTEVEVLVPSPYQATPKCLKYFRACGGCQHQALEYKMQLKYKQDRLEALFAKNKDVLHQIMGFTPKSSTQGLYAYRNKVEFTCSTSEWHITTQENEELQSKDNKDISKSVLGFFPTASPYKKRKRAMRGKRHGASWNGKIVSILSCELLPATCNVYLDFLQKLCRESNLSFYNHETNTGFLKNIILRRGLVVSDDSKAGEQEELLIAFVTTTFGGESQKTFNDEILSKLIEFSSTIQSSTKLVSIVQSMEDQAYRALQKKIAPKVQPKDKVLFGQSYLRDMIGPYTFEIGWNSFFQPNSEQAAVLYSVLRKFIQKCTFGEHGKPKKPVIWDLFCGVGTIGIFLSPLASHIVGLEINPSAIEAAKRNAALNSIQEHTSYEYACMDLGNTDISLQIETLGLPYPDIVILDPPRAGLHKKLRQLVCGLKPKYIGYVSCNPNSQEIDLQDFCTSSYTLVSLQPVDMLPQTPHIETVAWLKQNDIE